MAQRDGTRDQCIACRPPIDMARARRMATTWADRRRRVTASGGTRTRRSTRARSTLTGRRAQTGARGYPPCYPSTHRAIAALRRSLEHARPRSGGRSRSRRRALLVLSLGARAEDRAREPVLALHARRGRRALRPLSAPPGTALRRLRRAGLRIGRPADSPGPHERFSAGPP